MGLSCDATVLDFDVNSDAEAVVKLGTDVVTGACSDADAGGGMGVEEGVTMDLDELLFSSLTSVLRRFRVMMGKTI
jgi:hypothetical protein